MHNQSQMFKIRSTSYQHDIRFKFYNVNTNVTCMSTNEIKLEQRHQS